jgi:23S rRNA U2552 (ribose-2'-O)-methylase RlmE/FtsJ
MDKQMYASLCRPQQTNDDVKIVSVDLQAIAPIPGVVTIQGDITKVRYLHFLRLLQVSLTHVERKLCIAIVDINCRANNISL